MGSPVLAMRFKFYAVFFMCLFLNGTAQSQTVFSGRVGTAPIELVLETYAPGEEAYGLYVYTKHNSPIELRGSWKAGVLKLTEKDSSGKPAATLTVPNFDPDSTTTRGTWKSLVTGRELPLTLNRRYATDRWLATDESPIELLQAEALPSIYFKTVFADHDDSNSSGIMSVKLLDKKTGRLVQQVKAYGESMGMNSVSVGDYNFDGLADFSIFESHYASPNTSRLYFLYNPVTKRYVESGFTGTSLEFDAKKKRIYETNSCCAGTSVIKIEYKVVRNKMVLVAQHCYKWDDKRNELVERNPEACQ